MKTMFVTFLVLALAATAFGAAGDTIRSFSLSGIYSPRGVAYDWSDNNVWYAGSASGSGNDIRLGKFNSTTGSQIGSYVTLSGHYWVFDIGYGYNVSSRYIVAVDENSPRLRLYTTTGSSVGSMTDPFSGGYDEGVDCDWTTGDVYVTNYYQSTVQRWGGSSWSTFCTVPGTPTMGVATGWGRVFIVTTSSDYKIYEFNKSGSLNRSIPLNGWSRYMVGIATGRVNATGTEESVFIATFYPTANMVCEVSIGDITNTSITPTSLGKVKALYR